MSGSISSAACLVLLAACAPAASLRQGWALQSSAVVHDSGSALSTTAYHPQGWHRASLPSTVLSALVADGTYPDPYAAMNLRSIPGTSYPIGVNFSNLPMPAGSPFAVPWWYRTEFTLPAADRGKTIWLDFDGLNFRADVWLNGHQVASSDQLAGGQEQQTQC